MIVADVMDQLGKALESVVSLRGRVLYYPPAKITPPAAIIAFPDSVDFDQTYGRGMDRITIPVIVVAGNVSVRAARDRIVAFCNGSGSKSVKTALDGGTYTACDTVTVNSAELDIFTMSGIDYISATFEVDVTGSGT